MYYYNPYYAMSPLVRGGIFKNLFKGINFSSILNGTQRTLNLINQTIPVVKQVSPLVKNGKTLFKIMSEFNRNDTRNNSNSLNKNNNVKEASIKENREEKLDLRENEGLTFFQ